MRIGNSVVKVNRSYVKKETGFFGNPRRVSKTHAVINGVPICGCKIAAHMEFQWCNVGHHINYVECANCKRILKKQKMEIE